MNKPENDKEAVMIIVSLLSDTKGTAIHPENAEVSISSLYTPRNL